MKNLKKLHLYNTPAGGSMPAAVKAKLKGQLQGYKSARVTLNCSITPTPSFVPNSLTLPL